jgi:hypothetical protein
MHRLYWGTFRSLETFFREIEGLDLIRVVTFATLYLVIRFGYSDWYVKFATDVALLVFLFSHSVVLAWQFWAILASISTAALILNWETADNHKYLFVYWMWVMTLAHAARDNEVRDKILRTNARFFLVFIFLAAVLQKYLSPTYMSGSMFELILLTDSRFEAFSVLVGIDAETIQKVLESLKLLRSPAIGLANNEIAIPSSDYIHTVARLITWYDLYVQIAIGALFLFCKRITDVLGHVLLLFFIFTTYIPAPVFGFGWTLSVMGLCITKDRFRMLHLIYFFSFVAILLFHIPWREWILTA